MATRRRVKYHKKRYRGGEEFVERPFVAPKGINPSAVPSLARAHKAKEEARYQEWKKKREVEAREDLKGREEDAKMAAFNEKQKQQRAKELDDLRNLEEQRRKSVRKEEREATNPCIAVLKNAGVVGKTTSDLTKSFRRFSVTNHPDKGGDTAKYQQVADCYQRKSEHLEKKEGSSGGRRTRRRRHTRRRR